MACGPCAQRAAAMKKAAQEAAANKRANPLTGEEYAKAVALGKSTQNK